MIKEIRLRLAAENDDPEQIIRMAKTYSDKIILSDTVMDKFEAAQILLSLCGNPNLPAEAAKIMIGVNSAELNYALSRTLTDPFVLDYLEPKLDRSKQSYFSFLRNEYVSGSTLERVFSDIVDKKDFKHRRMKLILIKKHPNATKFIQDAWSLEYAKD